MTVAQANLAQRLVSANGRNVVFVKLSQQTDDPTKPWRGVTDARTTPLAQATVPMVTVPPSSASQLGLSTVYENLLARTDQIGIAAPGGASNDDLAEFNEIVDQDGSRWKIEFVETLNPAGAVRIVYFIGLRR